jgi:hypothetical protein
MRWKGFAGPRFGAAQLRNPDFTSELDLRAMRSGTSRVPARRRTVQIRTYSQRSTTGVLAYFSYWIREPKVAF